MNTKINDVNSVKLSTSKKGSGRLEYHEKMRQYRAELSPLVKEFVELGCSINQISKYLGYTFPFIDRIIKEYNIDKPKGLHNYCSINTTIKGYKHTGVANRRFNIVV